MFINYCSGPKKKAMMSRDLQREEKTILCTFKISLNSIFLICNLLSGSYLKLPFKCLLC